MTPSHHITSIHPGSCDGYTNLTDPWRNRAFNGFTTSKIDDLAYRWWRFTGIGGDRAITTSCSNSMGTFPYPRRVAVTYPVSESLTPTVGTSYIHYTGCSQEAINIDYVLCPGDFHVFRPSGNGRINSGFATCENGFFLFSSPLIPIHNVDYSL